MTTGTTIFILTALAAMFALLWREGGPR